MPVFYQDPKIERGDSLPEVVLTTAIENGAVFTDEESAALSVAVATGKPVIVNCTIIDAPNMSVVMHNYAGVGLMSVFDQYNFFLVSNEDIGGLWCAMIVGIQEDALASLDERLNSVESRLDNMPSIITVASEDDLPATADGGTIAIVEGE